MATSTEFNSAFPMPSSAVPMMLRPDTHTRSINITSHKIFCTFVPFDYKNKRGVYPKNPFAFDETMNPDLDSMIYFFNFHYLMTMVQQRSIGTPFIALSGIMGEMKQADYEKYLKNNNNYENNNRAMGSALFRSEVANRVADLKQKDIENPAYVPPEKSLEIPSKLLAAYSAVDANIYAINSNLGYYGSEPRQKFDIIFMPMYDNPRALKYDERGIFGFMAIFICYDPLWDMRQALHYFVRTYNEFLANSRNSNEKPDFTADPRILSHFEQASFEKKYSEHFSNYIQINPDMTRQVRVSGIDLNPANSNSFDTFLSFENAFLHASEYIGKKDMAAHGEWINFYQNITKKRLDFLTFEEAHDAYLYDYSKFNWNTNNQPKGNTAGKNGTGIYFEYFPWITRYYRREKNLLVGFERVTQSLLDYQEDGDDVMDIDDGSPPKSQAGPKSNLYTTIYEELMNVNTNSEDTFIHSDHNALVAVAERVRNDLQNCYSDMEKIRTDNTDFDHLLFPHDKNGLKSLSEEQVKRVNDLLDQLEKKNKPLRKLQERILNFVEKRIFTLANQKPLTSAILATIQYIEGKTIRTNLPEDGQSTLDINDATPLRDRNLSQYQLKMIDPNLDITAHGAMYYTTSTRYFGYNATCIFDAYKLKIGLVDAFRPEFNLHWNYGSFGPFGTSKSRALEVFKANSVPKVVTMVTSASTLANTSSKDNSDRIQIMDEASSLLGTNSKTPGANYSPEASAQKAILTQGYCVRHVLDAGKNYKERITRSIVSIQIGSTAATANIEFTDQAMKSRFHISITEGEADKHYAKKKATATSAASETLLDRQNRERQKLTMNDMILHTPSDMTRKTAKFFTESMQMEHCLSILVWKLVQVGYFKRPSTHIVCLVAVICKYIKTALKLSLSVRTVQRIILFTMSLSIITALNTVFNTPGIHQNLHSVPFSLHLFKHVKPYLYCTLQMVILAFSMMSCEFLKPADNILIEAVVDLLSTRNFPKNRIHDLFKHRNIERTRIDNPLYATINAIDKTVMEAEIFKDPLWSAFKECDTIPLELLYFEKDGKNDLTPFWRTITPGNMAANVAATKPKKVELSVFDVLAGGGMAAAAAVPVPGSAPPAPSAPFSLPIVESEADAVNRVDLNFWNTQMTRVQMIDRLIHIFDKRLIPDRVRSSFEDIENTKILVRTSMPATKKELNELARQQVAGQAPVLLPRHEREMNCIELDQHGQVCICVYIFSEVLNRPGNANVIIQALRSFVYQGLKPRTLLTGSEVSESFDLEFNTHNIRDSDLTNAPEYLFVTDPSLIQATIESKNREIADKITTNLRDLATYTNEIKEKMSEHDRLNTKENSINVTRKANQLIQMHASKTISQTIDNQKDQDFSEALQQPLPAAPRMNVNGVLQMTNEDSSNPAFDVSPQRQQQQQAKGHQRIYVDIDDWAFVNHCLDNGIAIRVNPNTRQYEYQHTPESDWEPIRTPLRLIELHRTTRQATMKESTLSAKNAAFPAEQSQQRQQQSRPDPGFGNFFSELHGKEKNSQSSAKRNREDDDEESIKSQPKPKKQKTKDTNDKEKKKKKKKKDKNTVKDVLMVPSSPAPASLPIDLSGNQSNTVPENDEDRMIVVD